MPGIGQEPRNVGGFRKAKKVRRHILLSEGSEDTSPADTLTLTL